MADIDDAMHEAFALRGEFPRTSVHVSALDADGTAAVSVTQWGVEGETTLVSPRVGPCAATIREAVRLARLALA